MQTVAAPGNRGHHRGQTKSDTLASAAKSRNAVAPAISAPSIRSSRAMPITPKYDVLVFSDGAFRRQPGAGGAGEMRCGSAEGGGGPDPMSIPAEYRGWLGRVSEDKTVPQLKQFVKNGGAIVTIGSSTALGELLGCR